MSKLVEEWRPVIGFEGSYEVSDWGNVKSADRWITDSLGRKRFWKGIVLKKVLNEDDYHVVSLRDENHEGHEGKVHQLVAKAFIPNPNGYTVVHHEDHNRLNNRVENLKWVDESEHQIEHMSDQTLRALFSERMKINNPMKRPEVAAKVAEKQRIIGKRRFETDPEAFFNKMNKNKQFK